MLPTAYLVDVQPAQSMGAPPAHIMNIMKSVRTWLGRQLNIF
jgi:hypothetical protein